LILDDANTIKRQMTTPQATIDTKKRIGDLITEQASSLKEAA
jgi:hypothetical protein